MFRACDPPFASAFGTVVRGFVRGLRSPDPRTSQTMPATTAPQNKIIMMLISAQSAPLQSPCHIVRLIPTAGPRSVDRYVKRPAQHVRRSGTLVAIGEVGWRDGRQPRDCNVRSGLPLQ